ncbi:MAG: hypothetical protein Q9P01_21975 [Anaerolineae bacterium]|nr:hypothetical protein [Anaerolineae bacterium]MDQ7037408.1 hypothetical protein [Anaerolineae bacterium]
MPSKKRPSLAERMKQKRLAKAPAEKEQVKKHTASVFMDRKQAKEQKASSLADRLKQKSQGIAKEGKEVEEKGAALSEEETVEITSAVEAVRQRYNDLIRRVKMTDLVTETTQLGNFIEQLPDGIEEIRDKGYKYHSYLEDKIDVLAEQWDDVNDKIEDWLEEEVEELEDDLARCEAYTNRLDTGKVTSATKSVADKLSAMLDTLDAKVDASEEKVKALYNEVNTESNKTKQTLAKIEKYLGWMDEAGFNLNAGEGLYMAAEAEWDDGKDKPDGFLFVTDQRIIFEQNEKTGKKFGMFGGKQTQEILWEVPVPTVTDVTPEDKGMFGGKDMMHMKMGSGAPYAELTLEIKGGIDSKQWAKEVKRVVKGTISAESTVEEDPELIERLRNAPTDCPNCGGSLSKLAAGANEITCKYCGTVVRV